MPNDIIIQSIAPVRQANDTIGEANTAVVQPSPLPQAAASPVPIRNPTLRFDSTLGLVVIEFRNDAGAVTTSVPSQQQLDAYQRWDMARLGPPLPGTSVPATPAPVAPVAKPQARASPVNKISDPVAGNCGLSAADDRASDALHNNVGRRVLMSLAGCWRGLERRQRNVFLGGYCVGAE